ncbi:ELWxxDGT repeat protein, partial [Caulobacter sp. KR2-114]|uniref:ELWxxDGT repeat protein n=1 Tax=Caulobacter sp. KR2-114 TaxID=3400912 RepID=UPI003C0F9C7B
MEVFTADDGVHGREIWRTDGTAAGTTLVADLDAGSESSNPANLTAAGPLIYFTTTIGSDTELWRTNGTAAGTLQLSTTTNGAGASGLTAVGGRMFFTGHDSVHGAGLFVSDGSAAGTAFVAAVSGASNLTAVGNALFFTASDATHGTELWVSDGTAAGTHMVSDIDPGMAGATPTSLTAFNGKLYFSANDGVHGQELWVSDGTAAGTQMVSDIAPAFVSSAPSNLTVADGRLFFQASDGNGTELWATDGTAAGTVKLTQPGSYFGAWGYFATPAGLYFENSTYTSSYLNLYLSDGTTAGTHVVATLGDVRFAPVSVGGHLLFSGSPQGGADGLYLSDGTPSGATLVASGSISAPVVIGGLAYFQLYDPNQSGTQLWVSDGSVAGTHLVKDFTPGQISTGLTITAFGSQALIAAPTGPYDKELWLSDGTAQGTHEVLNINPISPSGSLLFQLDFVSYGVFVPEATAINGQLLFSAALDAQPGNLFVSDGTAAGTGLAANLPPGHSLSAANGFTTIGGKLFFVAKDGAYATAQLWMTDGGVGDAVALTSTTAGFTNLAPTNLIAFGGQLYFDDADTTHGAGLFSADPATGTVRFVTAETGQMVVLGNELLILDGNANGIAASGVGLYATTGAAGDATLLWPPAAGGALSIHAMMAAAGASEGGGTHSGGTGSATVTASGGIYATSSSGVAVVINGPGSGGAASSIVVSGSKAFFSENFGASSASSVGGELYVSDGTAAGTHLVEDIAPGVDSSGPSQLTAFDGGVVFVADDHVHGQQVWFSDGSQAGTYRLQVNPTTTASAPLTLGQGVVFNGKLYFSANDGLHGSELWSSDGTVAGTAMVADVALGSNSLGPSLFTPLNGKLFFVDSSGEAWVTDGTANGATLLSTTLYGISKVTALDGKLYFTAIDHPSQGVFNFGLYATDGTAAGTKVVESFQTTDPIVLGDDLLFRGSGAPSDGLYVYSALTGQTTQLSTAAPYLMTQGGVVGGKLFYAGMDPNGVELWVSDGTAAGTHLLKDVNPGSGWSQPDQFTAVNGKMAFTTDSGPQGLWISDGTSAGTVQVAAMAATNLTAVGAQLYFVANDGVHGTELWDYDTTMATLTLAKDISPGAGGSSPANLTVFNGELYFTATDPMNGANVWRIDPTLGAVMVSTAVAGGGGVNGDGYLTVVGSKLFFLGSDAVHGVGLFVVDASNGAPTFLTSVYNVAGYTPSFFAAGADLYFLGRDATNGSELWVSDGTIAGTHRLTDTETPNGANASQFTVVGSQAFFSANDGVHGQELWVFNGAPGGAHMVADLNPTGDSNPANLIAMGGALYFEAADGQGKVEVWRSDGTAGGTVALTSASNGQNAQFLMQVGSKLFFYGSDSAHGAGLFVTDGTAAGTHFLLAYALPESFSDGFTAVGNELYFNGADSVNGAELWKSDGTVAGTVRVTDTQVDNGSYPQGITTLVPDHAPTDLNGDGRSDALFAGAGGVLASWELQDTRIIAGATLGSPGAGWRYVGTGDFDGDGSADMLFENAGGTLATWRMSGSAIAGGGNLGSPGAGWSEVGIGDFNGDGKSDVLFQNAAGMLATWDLNGTSIVGGGNLGSPGASWAVKAVADFDGDGKADILFENAAGQYAVWTMHDTTIAQSSQLGSPGAGWSFAGTGDF